MIYTNVHNIPEKIANEIIGLNKTYTKGGADFSVTGLIGTAWQHWLDGYGREATMDVSDLIARYRGKLLHGILGESDSDNLIEERLFMEHDGKSISGEPDWFNISGGIVYDLKSMLTRQHGFPTKDDHLWQLNIYAELLRYNGHDVKALKVMPWYVDHSAPGTASSTYPQCAILTTDVELKSKTEILEYLSERITYHSDPQPCTEEEKWSKFAVQKPGLKKASRVLDTRAEADTWGRENIGDLKKWEVVHRDGIRCRWYCDYSSICLQYQKKEQLRDRDEVRQRIR